MISIARSAAASSEEAMETLPESSTSILQPVDSMIDRIVLPPEPMTSRMRSRGICIVKMRGANGEMLGRSLDRDAGVHERQRAPADGGHGGGAVGLQDVGNDPDGIGELFLIRQNRRERAPGKIAVTDVAPRRAAQELRLADREGREVVV